MWTAGEREPGSDENHGEEKQELLVTGKQSEREARSVTSMRGSSGPMGTSNGSLPPSSEDRG